MGKMSFAWKVLPFVLCCTASLAQTQAVYKCQLHGKTTYSQEPCAESHVAKTMPVQGSDEPSGKSRNGSDGVRREKIEKKDKDQALTNALKSFDETSLQKERRQRRAKLTDSERNECSALDAQEHQQASVIHNSKDINVVNATVDALLANRKRFREVGC